jgi:hypothetical protein
VRGENAKMCLEVIARSASDEATSFVPAARWIASLTLAMTVSTSRRPAKAVTTGSGNQRYPTPPQIEYSLRPKQKLDLNYPGFRSNIASKVHSME